MKCQILNLCMDLTIPHQALSFSIWFANFPTTCFVFRMEDLIILIVCLIGERFQSKTFFNFLCVRCVRCKMESLNVLLLFLKHT